MAWSDLLGQAFAARILQRHLSTERVAGAYLLAGPEGVGKRRLALEMAKTLNCAVASSPSRPCDACAVCRQLAAGTHPDLHLLTPTGASEQVMIEQVRQLIGRLALRPFSARMQVAIVEGAERLTEEAANSMLKTLEEPSASARFILLTTQVSRCLPTIRSRCQLIRCQPLPRELIARILMEQRGIEATVAQAVARRCGGSASAAIALAERWSAHRELCAHLARSTPTEWVEQPLPESRQGVEALIEEMVWWLRDVAVAATAGADHVAYVEDLNALHRHSRGVDVDRCLEATSRLMALRESLEQFVNPRLIANLARETWLSFYAV